MANNYKLRIIFLFPIFSFFILFSGTVSAAVLYLEPSSGEYHQNDVFLAEIKLNTEGENINTVNVDLTFPQELLEVKDFSKGNSILIFWPEDPSISNQTGKIQFVGGTPDGYSGKDGLLGTIVFQVRETDAKLKRETDAKVEFSEETKVLLNDGFGASAKLSTQGANVKILPGKAEIPKDEWTEILKKDNIPPEPFEIKISQAPEVFEGKYFIAFFTSDKQTGIDYYEVKEGGGDWKRAQSPYLLEDQSLQSKILVRAVDKAGNERIAEFLPEIVKKPFPYGIVILILTGMGIGYWIIKSVKRKAKNAK